MDRLNFEKFTKKIEKSLLKKALGYNYKEVIEEYNVDDDGQKLSKRKITTKNVPPDLSAVKLLLDELIGTKEIDFSNMTDEQLKQEIKKSMEILENNYNFKENDDGNKETWKHKS